MGVTLQFQSTGTVPASQGNLQMRGGAITLGRSDQNDVMLPDPDKIISSRHCVIEDHGGNIVVSDISTNGTFLNYGKIPLGAAPTPLNDGDILCIGSYEILVRIDATASATLADPVPDNPAPLPATDMSGFLDPLGDVGGDGDFLDDLLGGPTTGPKNVHRIPLDDDDADDFLTPLAPPASPAQPANEPALSEMIPTPSVAPTGGGAIPDDWDVDLDVPQIPDDPFVEPLDTPVVAVPKDTLPPQPAPVAAPDPGPVPPPATATPDHRTDDAARAFLRALGAGDMDIADADLTATMERLGSVLNKMIGGIREILMTRQSIKSEFRIQQTVISAGANNPLKFSVSVDQSIQAMVRPAVKGYLPAEAATVEALDDIKAHEVATITGMEAALKGVLARLEPARLAERIAADTSLRSVLTNKKARYWDVFETQYQEISDQAENDFHELFSKEFARAYQAQLERLKTK